jgi:Holliday junction resolvase RusA-like endonuclease
VPAVVIYGEPVPKGSHKCVGRNGTHRIIDVQGPGLERWTRKLIAGAELLAGRHGPIPAPISVCATFTVPRPPSVKRPWPITRSAGDVDKLLRAALDALQQGGLIADDAQVIHVDAWTCYPDTPGAPDRLDRPGALLRIETLRPPPP